MHQYDQHICSKKKTTEKKDRTVIFEIFPTLRKHVFLLSPELASTCDISILERLRAMVNTKD